MGDIASEARSWEADSQKQGLVGHVHALIIGPWGLIILIIRPRLFLVTDPQFQGPVLIIGGGGFSRSTV